MLAKSFAVLSFAVSLSLAVPAAAQEVWPVKGKLLGKVGDKAEDVSGIACATRAGFPRTCLVIDDDVQDVQIVTLNEGGAVAGSPIKLIDDQFKNLPLELDGEAVAWDDDTKSFYVVGSHGHPRDKDHELELPRDAELIAASIKATSRVLRVKLDPASVDADGKLKGVQPDIKPSAMLRTLLSERPALQPFLDRRLDENGLTIEGAAVRDGRLYVGLRGPMLKGEAVCFRRA